MGLARRATAVASSLLLLAATSIGLVAAPALADVDLDTLHARALYFQGIQQTSDRDQVLQAIDAASPDDGALWHDLMAMWDEANTSLTINDEPPAGLPDSGHAFVLLGKGLNDDGTMTDELVGRLEAALASLEAYPNSRIVVTGGVEKSGWTEADRMNEWLLDQGIAPERIIVENAASNTQENGINSLGLLYDAGDVTTYTVISSASHIRRASVDFHAAALALAQERGVKPLELRSNVAFLDNTTSEEPPDAGELSLTAANVADVFGVLPTYRELVADPPPVATVSVSATPAAAGGTIHVEARFANADLLAADSLKLELTAPDGYSVAATREPESTVDVSGVTSAEWDVDVPADAEPATTVPLRAEAGWTTGDGVGTNSTDAGASTVVTGEIDDPFRTSATAGGFGFAQDGDRLVIAGGGSGAFGPDDEFGMIYLPEALKSGDALTTTVLEQSDTGPYARAGLVVRNDLSGTDAAGYATLALTPEHGCVFSWDSSGDGVLDSSLEAGGFDAPVQLRMSRDGDEVTASCSGDGRNWVDVASVPLAGAEQAVDAGLIYSAVNGGSGATGLATFTEPSLAEYTAPADAPTEVVSIGKPVTALFSAGAHTADAVVDGDRTNGAYWGSALVVDGEPTWVQIDLEAPHDLSSINVRNYVDGTRVYTYDLAGSMDGQTWFPLGGKSWSTPAPDEGDPFTLDAVARYVRVIGLSNTANASFHVTEVTVRGGEATLANLVAEAVSGSQAVPGGPVELSAEVTNGGHAEAADVTVQFLEGDDVLATSEPISLEADESGVATATWDPGERSGEVEVTAIVDPDDAILESDETDNSVTGTVTVAPVPIDPTEPPTEGSTDADSGGDGSGDDSDAEGTADAGGAGGNGGTGGDGSGSLPDTGIDSGWTVTAGALIAFCLLGGSALARRRSA